MKHDITPEVKNGAGATGPTVIYTVFPPKDDHIKGNKHITFAKGII